ncbi:MAG: 4-hydroxy-tetrahydrodipicolinate synthase [Kiloniellales bacterium]|nr:4-hydroxy-tetrahydrodipicolinate synthase [Kiloniellales bacterium]
MPFNQNLTGGLWLPIVTPFLDGALDTRSLEHLVRHYAAQPLDGLIVAATTGEGLTLTAAEIREAVTIVAGAAAGALPVYLGLAGSDTAELAARLERTATWPLDGYLVSCPSYSRPSQEGLLRHFTTIASAVDRPLALYNIPYRTGVNMSNETVLALAEIDTVVGIKDCCQDMWQTFDLIRRRPAGFSVLTGEDALYYSALAHGADGAILASAHVETAGFAGVRDALAAGDWGDALARWAAIADLTRLLFAEPSPAGIKHWLWRAGLIASPELRLPMTGASPALATRIDAVMAARTG